MKQAATLALTFIGNLFLMVIGSSVAVGVAVAIASTL